MATKAQSLAHTSWLCEYKGVTIIEGHLMIDHVQRVASRQYAL